MKISFFDGAHCNAEIDIIGLHHFTWCETFSQVNFTAAYCACELGEGWLEDSRAHENQASLWVQSL